MKLEPKPGFDWTKVIWSSPDDASPHCSYCDNDMPVGRVPLRLRSRDGRAAQFCDACMKRWWTMELFSDS